MIRNFIDVLSAQWAEQKFLCVGLDPDYEKIPEAARGHGVRESIVAFNRAIIDATKDIVCSYKPNSAFYEAHGDEGLAALEESCAYIRDYAPHVPIILDAKRADIGNTNLGYAAYAFEYVRADAITLHPYLGAEALQPFLEQKEKGMFILCRTSNPGAGEFQDLEVAGEPLYVRVAKHVATKWNGNGNCGLVVGATFPEELRRVRKIAPEIPILIPGLGSQGGDVEQAVAAAGTHMIVSVSREILYASHTDDFAQAARRKAQEFDSAIRKAF